MFFSVANDHINIKHQYLQFHQAASDQAEEKLLVADDFKPVILSSWS